MGMRPTAPAEIIDPSYYARHGYPHEAWEKLRREAPVAWCELEGFPPFWAVTRHEDIVRLSKDPTRFLNGPGFMIFPEEQYDNDEFPVHHVLNMDPPEHREYRGLVSHLFTPRAIEGLRPAVERLVDDILNGVAGRSEIDFVTEVAAVMPIAVIADLLGVPAADRGDFFRWTNESVGPGDAEYQDGATAAETVQRGLLAMFEYFQSMVADRRREPRDDIVSLFATGRLRGAPVPEHELLSNLVLLVNAGNETTRNAASGGLLALLEHPTELERLRTHPDLLPAAIEEILRWTSPVIHMVRTPVEDVELHGVRIRAGEPLTLFYPSANRDDRVFEDPYNFRVDRRPNRHLAFGIGEHVCLGAHLARLELQILFRKLLARLGHAELAGPVERLHASIIGGIKHVPLKLELR